mgnify:CR=1 FL=1
MKTNIKLRVTPEQSKAVQNICFANGVFWYAGNGNEVRYTKAEYLFIDSDRVWFRVITDHNIGTETEGYTEVDADLFIRTNGTCEEDKKEMDLRNTWCYATVPNHDRLRLLGYNHMPVGCCKSYYYIDCNTNISDLDSHPNFKPDYNEIKLNEKGKFEYATLSSQQDNSECNFTKFGFEKPNFECKILGEIDGVLYGATWIQINSTPGMEEFNWYPEQWDKVDGSAHDDSKHDLTPIKKPWYETCTFPCIIMADYCMPVVVKHYDDGYVYDFRGNKYCTKAWRLLTNTEIEGLKQ